jgi:hypothetical protein
VTNARAYVDSRHVKADQLGRVEVVRSTPFLERHVRPLLARGSAGGSGDGPGGWRTTVIQLDGIGAATVQISLHHGSTVFAKIFPFDHDPEVYAKLKRYRASGFGESARYQTVEPLAWLPAEQALICREAPGAPIFDLLAGDVDRLSSVCAEAGRWLGTFHASQQLVGRPQSLLVTGELVSLAKRLAKVLARTPNHLEVALDMLSRLDRLTKDTVDGLLAQSHGQYRPIHVFIDDATVTVIDLDRSGPADPARDCAEFLHHLRRGVHGATGDVTRADEPCTAFIDGYRQAGGQQRLTNLRFHWARYLFHSLNRQVKDGKACTESAEDPTCELIRTEFDRVVEGRAGA